MEPGISFARVSTDKQEQHGFSLQEQEDCSKSYASTKGISIVREWKVAETAWVKKERKVFNAVVLYAKKHPEVKHVLFDTVDRMTRNDFDKAKILNLIYEYNKTIHLVREGHVLDKNMSSEMKLLFGVQVLFAEKFSDDVSAKTKIGMRGKAKEGIFPTCTATGYRNNTVKKTIEPDPVTAPLIKSLFERAATGSFSIQMLGEILYAEGLRNPRTNKQLCKATIHRILHNPMYYGYFMWGKQLYKGTHEPIVSKDLSDRAIAALANKARPHVTKRNFPYNNLLRCGVCGCTFGGGIAKKKYVYYSCSLSKKKHKRKSHTELEMESFFKPAIDGLALPSHMEQWLKKGIKEKFGRKALEIKTAEAELKAKYDSIYKDLENWYVTKATSLMPEKMFMEREASLKKQLADIEGRISDSKYDPEEKAQEAVQTLELIQGLAPAYAKATNYQKAEILKMVGTGYIINRKTITPTYRAPFDLIALAHKKGLKLDGMTTESSKRLNWGG